MVGFVAGTCLICGAPLPAPPAPPRRYCGPWCRRARQHAVSRARTRLGWAKQFEDLAASFRAGNHPQREEIARRRLDDAEGCRAEAREIAPFLTEMEEGQMGKT